MKLADFFQNNKHFAQRALGASCLLLSACSQGIFGGSVLQTFSGLQKINLISPKKIELVWNTNARCLSYKIYQRSNAESAEIATVAVPPARLEAPLILPDRQYTFSVGCVENGTISGVENTLVTNIWVEYDGNLNAGFDTSAGNNITTLKLNWNYIKEAPVLYEIYAKESLVPNDLGRWVLGSTEQPICQTFNQEIRIGLGGDCDPPSLVPGRIYNFKVVVRYSDQTTSRDLLGKGVTVTLPPSFALPSCQLTRQGLGPENKFSYLYLRCEASTGNSCTGGRIQARAFQSINGYRQDVSDVLQNVNANAALRIEPVTDLQSPKERIASALEIEYSCVRPGYPTQYANVRYDRSSLNHPEPNLKYFGKMNKASGTLAGAAPSYFGKANQVIGDFDCDGNPDLAVGMPNLSYTQAPYFSRNANSGAIKVYYNYNQPDPTGQNTQILSFRDLPDGASVGGVLAVGNINKDVHLENGKVYSCDDLIFSVSGTGDFSPRVVVVFGNHHRFPDLLDLSALRVNEPTCSDKYLDPGCSPVVLMPNHKLYFKQDDYSSIPGVFQNQSSGFGQTISYIRDYDADGYGDIAIGAPWADFPGFIYGGDGLYSTVPAPEWPQLRGVGAVYVFTGSRTGIKPKYLGKLPDNTPINSPYIPIYPPIPQEGMMFGASISTGGEVDGALPVPVDMGNGNIILAEGNDFVVGAPNFNYSGSTVSFGRVKTPKWSLDATTDTVDPALACSNDCGNNQTILNKITAPIDGGYIGSQWNNDSYAPVTSNTTLRQSSGIAFLYLGRHARTPYQVTFSSEHHSLPYLGQLGSDDISNFKFFNWISLNFRERQSGSPQIKLASGSINAGMSPIQSFYNCWTRGSQELQHNGLYNHISCGAGRNNFKTITPPTKTGTTSTPFSGFGSMVQIAASSEQNLPALYELRKTGSAGRDAEFTYYNDTLYTHQQGLIHERVLGTSLWEVGLPGINAKGNGLQTAQTGVCSSFASGFNDSCKISANTGTFNIARSAITESYKNWTKIEVDENAILQTSSLNSPTKKLVRDINQDGYADILLTSTSSNQGPAKLWTFFGNPYADFNYSSTYATSGSCTTSRNIINQSDLNSGVPTEPFNTFMPSSETGGSRITAGVQLLNEPRISTSSKQIYAPEYPNYITSSSSSNYIWARWLGDNLSVSDLSSSGYMPYGGVPNRESAGLSCKPQSIALSSNVTALAVADINADGIQDAIAGFSTESSYKGNAVAYQSDSNANGFNSFQQYKDGILTGTQTGSSIAASRWSFLSNNFDSNPVEPYRRDLMVGAPYQTLNDVPAAGVIQHYVAYNNDVMNSSRPAPNGSEVQFFKENSNINTDLNFQASKIIGDVNGDGYADILAPYKQITATGGIYYDAIIYFGSPFGPITTTYCLEKLSKFKNINDQNLTASDCEASTITRTAKFEDITFRLPLKITKPSTMDTDWVLHVAPAGDVNGDGKDDVLFIGGVGPYNSASKITLFFGTDDGLKSGDPAYGASSNLYPQIVYEAGLSAGSTIDNRDINPSIGIVNVNGNTLVHGDFNGDGYEDLAFSTGASSPSIGELSGSSVVPAMWKCKISPDPGGEAIEIKTVAQFCDSDALSPTFNWNSGTNPTRVKGNALPIAGAVIVIYGGRYGYQASENSIQYNPGTCTDFFENCSYDNNYSSLTARPVYKSLNIDYSGNEPTYNIDSTKTACTPTGGNTSMCTAASAIPNPFFVNAMNSFQYHTGYFGNTLTVADVNGDGIDDLIISHANFSHGLYSRMNNSSDSTIGVTHREQFIQPGAGNSLFGGLLETTTDDDSPGKGSVLIYYGTRGYGVVAPKAQYYFGNQSLGLTTYNHVPFRIYPRYVDPHDVPSQEYRNGVASDINRNIGFNVSAGDFNGDGKDDLVISTSKNTFYTYYGPLCNAHNGGISSIGSPMNEVLTKTYQHIGAKSLVPGEDPSADELSGVHKDTCVGLSFNTTGTQARTPNSLNPRWAPKLAVVPSVDATQLGHTLVSFTTKNGRAIGDVNYDIVSSGQKRYTDLLIGTPYYTDANAKSGTTTGIGIVLFGGELGLYSDNPNYNSYIYQNDVNGKSYLFLNPLLLRPHPADGSIGGFYNSPVTAGDLNGDGSLDYMVPTSNIDETDNAQKPSLKAGGFMLFY